jgi:hypothetical protein
VHYASQIIKKFQIFLGERIAWGLMTLFSAANTTKSIKYNRNINETANQPNLELTDHLVYPRKNFNSKKSK